jgi:hypothetical protein
MGVMSSYPVDIRRCQHIKTSGAQCGSPALKDKEFCYYHQENRTVPAAIYLEGERYPDDHIMIPPLEDAHAVQMVVRHVIQLMMERRIDRKDASLMLYALQIASGNLKQMREEKPRPTQVVREPEKAGETPMGMTPWSAKGEGHDVEDDELAGLEKGEKDEAREERPSRENPAPLPTAEEAVYTMTVDERCKLREEWHKSGRINKEQWEDWIWGDAEDPMVTVVRRDMSRKQRKLREAERRNQAEACYQCKQDCGDRVTLEEAGLGEAGDGAPPPQASGGRPGCDNA